LSFPLLGSVFFATQPEKARGKFDERLISVWIFKRRLLKRVDVGCRSISISVCRQKV